jgi:hypothetical protein
MAERGCGRAIKGDGRSEAATDRSWRFAMSAISSAWRTGAGSPLSFAGHRLGVAWGQPLSLGANLTPSGVNFALICRHATAIR